MRPFLYTTLFFFFGIFSTVQAQQKQVDEVISLKPTGQGTGLGLSL